MRTKSLPESIRVGELRPAPPAPRAPSAGPRRRLRDWLATAGMLLLIPAMLVFLLPGVRAAHPTLGVDGAATRGSSILVSGGGYAGFGAIELRWEGGHLAAQVRPDRDGEFQTALSVPASMALGEHDLLAIDPTAAGEAGDAGDALASTIVTVVDAIAEATPDSHSGTPAASDVPAGTLPPGASPSAPASGGSDGVAGNPTATPGGDTSAGPRATSKPASKATPKPKPKATATPQPPAPATSGALYVATNGSDGNPGTADAPFRTVEKGLDSVRPGQTLYLRGGTYVEDVQASPAGMSSARIVVSAYPGERPVIKGLVSINNPRYVTFNGFNVTWNTGSYDEHMLKITGGTSWVLQNSEIWGARSFADLLISGSPHGWAVRYNVIHDTYGGEADVNRSHNIYANTNLDATGGVIERNLIFNATHGTNLKLAGAGGADGGAANVIVRYNTLYNATQPLLIGDGSRNITVTRNIIGKSAKGNLVRLYALVGSSDSVKDNILFAGSDACSDYGSTVKCSSVMSGNLFPHDPHFASGGFHPTDAVAANYGRYAR
jgi:hypothetical protein